MASLRWGHFSAFILGGLGVMLCTYPSLPPLPQGFAKGFSLLEVILTLILVATASVVVLPKYALDTPQAIGEVDQLHRLLRLGQQIALSSGCEIQVNIQAQILTLHYTGRGQHRHCPRSQVIHPLTGSVVQIPLPAGLAQQSWFYDAQGYAPSRPQQLPIYPVALHIEAVSGLIFPHSQD